MKILLLSCNTGNGHNSAAKALVSCINNNYHITCSEIDVLKLAGKTVSEKADKIYCGMVVKSPASFNAIYKAGELVSKMKFKSPVYYANTLYAYNLAKFIHSHGFDTIIFTHLFPMETITYIKKRYLPNIKTYGIFTDYTCIPFVSETQLDAYFIPHEDLIYECVSKGMDIVKLVPTGIPVDLSLSEPMNKITAKRLLNLPTDKHTILVMTGGMGFGKVTQTCSCLLSQLDDSCHIVVLTGRNKELKKNLDMRFYNNPQISSVSFTDDVQIYLNAADIILTKPGGMTSTEVAALRKPLIHTLPIPGCETQNAIFFSERNMSLRADTPKQAASLTSMLLNSRELRNLLVSNQEKYINPYAADDIISYIVGG